MLIQSLEGAWKVVLSDGTKAEMYLPGTLDENRIGYKDRAFGTWHPDTELGNAPEDFDFEAPIGTRFTRKYTFEGEARLSRQIDFVPPADKRIFVEAERARHLELLVDGVKMEHFVRASISTPYIFEVTEYLKKGSELTFLSDNSYPGWPRRDIVYSSAATDETQTNWNGILGYFRIRVEEQVFVSAIRVYPCRNTLTVKVEISTLHPYEGYIRVMSEALKETAEKKVSVPAGRTEIVLEGLSIAESILRWDEYEGNLYDLTVSLDGYEDKSVTFGIRDFGDNGKGRLALNGRTLFIRSEANCAEFPETGHPPMAVSEWLTVLETYKSYGINMMRFHSHCPPEAAFTAADQLGMLMQPELSNWNPKNAFESDESYAYYAEELKQILLDLANHPSFVMLTFGNELWSGEIGHHRMNEMLDLAHSLDGTRLFACGSNVHYGTIGCDPKSDFYTSNAWYDQPLRGISAGMPEEGQGKPGDKVKVNGYINNTYPNAKTSYDTTMAKLRENYRKPVFSFEVGQYEVLPYFEELDKFKGISDPANYRVIREKAEKLGRLKNWNRYVEATGMISRMGYREEIEAAMRTRELSGISLLGLQDFPGQGTAVVGMLDSHLEPKPFDFARPEEFQKFFRDQLPLVLLDKYTYEHDEVLRAEVVIANYGKGDVEGIVTYTLKEKSETNPSGKEQKIPEIKRKQKSVEICEKNDNERVMQEEVIVFEEINTVFTGELPYAIFKMGDNTSAGMIEIPLNMINNSSQLELTVTIGNLCNTYPIWVYVKSETECPNNVYETKILDEKALEVLREGGRVYLSPDSEAEHLPSSILAQFTTDFWSVGTFPAQEGGMGQFIDDKHPIFQEFPTEFYTNWQWWPMASQRAIILPEPIEAIITEMDSYAYMRPMAQLFECRCHGGKLLVSSLGLQNLQNYPEGRALQTSIYHYLESDAFDPKQELQVEMLQKLVK